MDDHLTNLKLARDVLEFEGYQILSAVDAEEAMQIIEDRSPDLILMDVGLPGMDGLTLTRKLKSDAETRHIPVVVLTASAMKGDDRRAMEAGADGYITKPIDTRQLPATVAEILKRLKSPRDWTALKILVIEDHLPQLKLAHHILTAAGHDVSKVMTAEEAPEAIRNDKPQIILLDMNLPGMDGIHFARTLRADANTRDILIVGVTASPETYSLAAAMEAGCDAYLHKPINTRTLPAEIIEAFNSHNRQT